MVTTKQELGALGEQQVVRHCACPRCKRERTLKTLPPNFKCADVICDFCGYLGQSPFSGYHATAISRAPAISVFCRDLSPPYASRIRRSPCRAK
jgi:hypothetical protein